MSLRLDCLGVAASVALLALGAGLSTGCNNQGHSGDACEADASAIDPIYTCNTGLVCNTGKATPTCESPNLQGANGPCGDDDNCQSGLYCAVSRTCEALLSAGEPCPDETGCGAGLMCANVPTPTCVADDASLGSMDATVVSSSGGDAAAGDASKATDASEVSDATATGDASCGASDEAGEHAGTCPTGGMCCSGGAVGTFYCYTGESGTCPAVP